MITATGCGEDDSDGDGPSFVPAAGGGVQPPTTPTCDATEGGSTNVARPEPILTLFDRWEEGWLGSPEDQFCPCCC